MTCEACSWSPERQARCFYSSHVKLFEGLHYCGQWSLGSQYILLERPISPPHIEARNLRFVKQQTSIPVPTVVLDWEEENGRGFMLTKRIQGQTLDVAWPTMTTDDKERVARQTAECILQLRKLQSPQMQGLEGHPIFGVWLFGGDWRDPHGPLSSDDELWNEMEKRIERVPIDVRQRLRERMPPAAPFTFTCGDLSNDNIIVKDGNFAGIKNWIESGYFPVWWEFAYTAIGASDEDAEWKHLLRKYMPDHTGAFEFYHDLLTITHICSPEVAERREKVLQELRRD